MDTVEIFPVGSRTTVIDPTKPSLTSEFGKGSGVTMASMTVPRKENIILNLNISTKQNNLLVFEDINFEKKIEIYIIA